MAKNTFWLTVSNVGGRLLRAVIIIYAARMLGAAEWGIFSYAISIVTFVTVFTDVGISPILVRETAKLRNESTERTRLLSTSFALKSVFLALGIFIVLAVVPRFGIAVGAKALLPIAVLILIFDTFRELGFSLVRAIERMEWEAALYLATNAAIVGFGFAFLYSSPSVTSFAYAYAAGTGLGMIATIYVLRKYLSGIFSGFSWRTAKYILFSGWPFALSAIMGVLLVDTSIILVGWFRSAEEVGFLAAAQRMVQLLYLLPGVLGVSLLPIFSRLAGKEDGRLQRGLETALGLVYLAAIPIAIGGALTGKEIMSFLFGSEYLGAAAAFQILLLGILINFPAGILSDVVFIYNKQKRLTLYAMIGGFSNLVLGLLVIPRFGITGSAVVTLIAQLAANIYLWHITKKIVRFTILPRLKKAISAAVLTGILVLALKALSLHIVPVVILAGAAYFALLLIMHEPLIDEVKLLRQAER